MKKFFNSVGYSLPIVAALALITIGTLYLVSCSDQKVPKSDRNDDSEERLYTGLLPAADTDGIRYTLHLEYDEDHNFKGGEYHLIQTYLVEDTTQNMHTRDIHSSNAEGTFEQISGSGDDYALKYIKLTPDRNSNGDRLYFLIESDSTLVLVDEQLKPSQNPQLNYTLRRVKE